MSARESGLIFCQARNSHQVPLGPVHLPEVPWPLPQHDSVRVFDSLVCVKGFVDRLVSRRATGV